MSKEIEVKESSGNVFADLGFEEPQEELAKADIICRICEIIQQQKLTQAQAAKILGIDQPKISALMRGKSSGFSSDRLFRFLNALDRDVEIVIKPKLKRNQASIRVVTQPSKVAA